MQGSHWYSDTGADIVLELANISTSSPQLQPYLLSGYYIQTGLLFLDMDSILYLGREILKTRAWKSYTFFPTITPRNLILSFTSAYSFEICQA